MVFISVLGSQKGGADFTPFAAPREKEQECKNARMQEPYSDSCNLLHLLS